TAAASSNDTELLWLLTEDSAPEPKALDYMLRTVIGSKSTAIAGPKLIDWDSPQNIVELGQSMTRGGTRWLLRRQELDQQQHDHLQDTLGVGPIGMLVRRDVWQDLHGFDPALAVYDDGLDLSVRARLAGHRVVVAPKARVRVAMSGIAGPRLRRSRRTARQNNFHARTAHLHRRIKYAPALLAPFMWLALPLLGVFRVFWSLLRERPGFMLGEFFAALCVFFAPGKILRARRILRRHNTAGWGAIRPLRQDPKTVRTSRLIDKEAILAAQGRKRRELHFISTGGVHTLLFSSLASIALCWWLYGQTSLSYGGSVPLSDFGTLWQNTRVQEGVPADPFTWLLAGLGSLTFFNPSLAVVLFLIVCLPAAAMGGWFWGAQFTEKTAGRVLAAFAWGFSPVVLGSLDHSRIQTVVLAVALPWLLIAATRAHQSWAWAGTASLLAAAALAAAPVLMPAAVLLWLLGMVLHPRSFTRIFATALAPAALFFPIFWRALAVGDLLSIFRDPGLNTPYTPASLQHLLLGFPQQGLEGWSAILAGLGVRGLPVTLLIGALLAPLAILAVLGVFTGKAPVTIFSALLGGLGMVTAIFSANTALVAQGGSAVHLWTGSGLALYWIALVTLAASGSENLGKIAVPVAGFATVTALVAAAPLLAHLATGQSPTRNVHEPLPSIVQAAGARDPQLRTLAVTALTENTVRARVLTGAGNFLDEIRTAAFTANTTAAKTELAQLVGELGSSNSKQLAQKLQRQQISYVLLRSGGDLRERDALQTVFDEQAPLINAGQTAAGTLWRVKDAEKVTAADRANAAKAASDRDAQNPLLEVASWQLTSQSIWIVQLVVLGAVVLLALPTGAVTEQPPKYKRKRQKRKKVRDTTTEARKVSEKVASAAEISKKRGQPVEETEPDLANDPDSEPSVKVDFDTAEPATTAPAAEMAAVPETAQKQERKDA
ncbi:MAG: glycosyltransferase, partial [Microbacteriaceae bacterium]|nr:glycosyltransferase [Microbacteriaceae bacterium]